MTMRVGLDYGRDRVELEAGTGEVIVHQPPAAVAATETIRAALEQPVE
jgi:hypothetical protein